MDLVEIMRTVPPEVRKLVFRREYAKAFCSLYAQALEVNGLGPARVQSLLGADPTTSRKDPFAQNTRASQAITLWAVYVREIWERPDRWILEQKDQIEFTRGEDLKELRRLKNELFSLSNVNSITPARWDKRSVQSMRAWLSNFYNDEIVIPEDFRIY